MAPGGRRRARVDGRQCPRHRLDGEPIGDHSLRLRHPQFITGLGDQVQRRSNPRADCPWRSGVHQEPGHPLVDVGGRATALRPDDDKPGRERLDQLVRQDEVDRIVSRQQAQDRDDPPWRRVAAGEAG